MSFNNGPYIFSDVPGFEASKGERIVKAFRKLWAKINRLEQAKIIEKNTCSQEVQASNHTDLTISDIKYEILLTQLRYLIKIVREYANGTSSDSVDKDNYETTTDFNPGFSSINFRPMHENPDIQYEDHKDSLPGSTTPKIVAGTSHHEQRDVNDHQVSTTGTQTSNKINVPDTTERLLQDHLKQDSHSHYHLKLDDVPFILGASSTASHSVVANVQNIIALMKSHNKALCTLKPQIQREVNSAKIHKTDTQDANKMLQQLSEDLSKLTMKQERLKAMLDNANANPHSSDANTKHLDAEGQRKREVSNNAGDAGQSTSTGALKKNSKQLPRKKSGANFGNQDKPIIPTVRVQTNEDPQLARRKMLRSLKDFKTHLSEEDLSWK
ncbi:centrosomal protein of 57 kDa-like isoform X2 [Argiope bruennichi]|uniref:centrosomal protein of 57 kDa-like isoform X2 n=1 Tax=Argiope bruennichi TaxID=94029 RepID=UPI002494504C|nr:centrosomal protein of 57 kDa-like isoform X2 [Argiope bruennichi]